MARIGRNQPCPCGSALKYKKCHGSLAAPLRNAAQPSRAEMEHVLRKHETIEAQRVKQQGRGRPIISTQMGDSRFVAVGNRLAYGKWLTFGDFLMAHLKERFGYDWGQLELAKPEMEQHPLFKWLFALADLMARHKDAATEVNSMPAYGAARAVYSLAYDLYLIDHHAETDHDRRAIDRLLKRLRNPEQFAGARHEARAAGLLLRGGFELEWEDEDQRRDGGHGEFTATFPDTKRRYWVECKMRQSTDDEAPARFTHLISSALKKATDLPRMVFVELNLPDGRLDKNAEGWPGWAINQLRMLEEQPKSAALPPALIFLSNFPEGRQLLQEPMGTGLVLEGFKDPNFRFGDQVTLTEAIERRDGHIEVESLWKSVQDHSLIPTTFDGSIHGLEESTRLLIGHTYELPGNRIATLVDAVVMEQWKQAIGTFTTKDGEVMTARFDLTQAELAAWNQHPETFFGELRPASLEAKNPLDLYDFFLATYSKSTKDNLLAFMAESPDINELCILDQPSLAKRYAFEAAAAASRTTQAPAPPAWHGRLRRRKVLGVDS